MALSLSPCEFPLHLLRTLLYTQADECHKTEDEYRLSRVELTPDPTLQVTDPVTHKTLFDQTREEIFPTHPLVDFRIRQTFVSFSL